MSPQEIDLVVLIGLQASGKTTFRRRRFDATHTVVSKDLLRNNRRPQRRQLQLIQAALEAGCSVVVDNTNPRLEDRAALIELARQCGARVRGFYLSCSVESAMRRNGQRVGRERVPDIGILATAKVLQLPSRVEGFDELHFVTVGEDGEFIVELFQEVQNEAG